MSKHSPAPWRNGGPATENDANLHIYDANGIWVGTARPWSLMRANMAKQQANADLMVAAPLLLDALRELHAVMHFDCKLDEGETLVEVSRFDFNAAAEKALAAIAALEVGDA